MGKTLGIVAAVVASLIALAADEPAAAQKQGGVLRIAQPLQPGHEATGLC
jgi:hypothetical protein